MGLSIDCLYSWLRLLKYIVQFSSLDLIFFFGICEVLTSHCSVLFLSHFAHFLLTVGLAMGDPNTVQSCVEIFILTGSPRFTSRIQISSCSTATPLLLANCSIFNVRVFFNYIGFSSLNNTNPLSHLFYSFTYCIVHTYKF